MNIDDIFALFAENKAKGLEANAQENVDLAGRLHETLCDYGFDYPMAIFSTIGQSYVQNIEMKKKIDKFGEGTAQYVCDAIQEYVGWL